MNTRSINPETFDTLGMLISVACAVHCLGFTLAFALLPALGHSEEHSHEWLHPIFFTGAIISVWFALKQNSQNAGNSLRWAFALSGLGFLLAGMAAHEHPMLETLLSIVGASILGYLHWTNYQCKKKSCACDCPSLKAQN